MDAGNQSCCRSVLQARFLLCKNNIRACKTLLQGVTGSDVKLPAVRQFFLDDNMPFMNFYITTRF